MDISNETIERVLIEEDVVGLRHMGAPPSEYESAAEMIGHGLRAISGQPSQTEVTAMVAAVVLQLFDPPSNATAARAAYARVARRICESSTAE